MWRPLEPFPRRIFSQLFEEARHVVRTASGKWRQGVNRGLRSLRKLRQFLHGTFLSKTSIL